MSRSTPAVDLATPGPAARRRPAGAPWLTPRGRWLAFALVSIGWSAWRAGIDESVINQRGWSRFAAFWRALGDPDLTSEFLALTARAAGTTVAYAVLGTALATGLGAVAAPLLARRVWEIDDRAGRVARAAWYACRLAIAVPRAVHETVWAILLVLVLGFDPLVAVLAIGLPFGAVTAKVFAEIVDEADPGPYRALRASGAGRLQALAYGILPVAATDLASYAFYRLECAIRSAAILGVVGAGGIGAELDLSFESLRYDEIWTLLAALVLLSGLTDAWSSAVRRRHGGHLPDGSRRPGRLTHRRDPLLSGSVVAIGVLFAVSWVHVGLDPRHLWSGRTRRLAGDLIDDLWPPRLGPGGAGELLTALVDTMAMSVLALAIAVVGGLALALVGRRRPARPLSLALALAARGALLVCRAVPPIVWAFVVVLVVFPGIWPGAIALGVYNLGVLGRLFAEILEDVDPAPARAIEAAGVGPGRALLYGSLPVAAPRLAAMSLYRWEVLLRETVVVGIVGAGGIGRLMQEHLAARDHAAVAGAILGIAACTVLVDALSSRARRALR